MLRRIRLASDGEIPLAEGVHQEFVVSGPARLLPGDNTNGGVDKRRGRNDRLRFHEDSDSWIVAVVTTGSAAARRTIRLPRLGRLTGLHDRAVRRPPREQRVPDL